ncbi:TetR/AcrR family transcriptional regulator [Nocardia cyriacigeorgica]|uniref:TetR/AcrR family transcriptional regulator n=1 Tax=Nocardia cyriacigeorgica TaxID=135487 RepID=A0A5R8PCE8_9NOCA|nr:QsdR family transcriptional regulator [Nocardia cyriacigeorgica]TLG08664.1 TetR/AcrR family transcriptional regulator [Nocardia cyriacigeorgica]
MIATSEGRRAIDAATKLYLAGEPLDMTVLARTLGIGRATLYRHVGNREELIATVLAEATERTYRKEIAAGTGTGAELILDVLGRLMRTVSGSEPLLALTRREPQVFIRLALLPGVIESTSARLIAEMLDEQQQLGHLHLRMSSRVLADAIVRICDVHLYAPLLGGDVPQIETALDIVALLLGHDRNPPEGPAA